MSESLPSSSSERFAAQVELCAQRLADYGVPALSGLFDLTAQRLVRFATTITRNQHDAEDAVQAALVKVAARTDTLVRADRPWPYLLQMVRNEALAAARKQRRWIRLADLTDLVTRRLVDQVEQEETHRAIWIALRKLPTEQAEVVVLKIWEELTFAQIAEILTIAPATAASRYRYALAKLTQLLVAKRGPSSRSAEAKHE
jgi:RNA polymerase sigma-70 factor (ECF subfamily)